MVLYANQPILLISTCMHLILPNINLPNYLYQLAIPKIILSVKHPYVASYYIKKSKKIYRSLNQQRVY